MNNKDKVIYDLCGGTRAWSKPYKDAGYDVRVITLPDYDIRKYILPFPHFAYGILFAPPCTVWANSGARWWKDRTPNEILEAVEVLMAGIRIIWETGPIFWAIENPVGKMRKLLGEPRLIFNPCDYGDNYTKKTLLWGKFNIPWMHKVEPTEGSKMHRLPPGEKRTEIRSITPQGFAQAFYEANK